MAVDKSILMEVGDNYGLSFLETSRVFDTMLGFDRVIAGTDEQAVECLSNVITGMVAPKDESSNISYEKILNDAILKTYGDIEKNKEPELVKTVSNSKRRSVKA